MSKPNMYCGECPVWLADAEGGAECDACIVNKSPKYVVHIPTNCCYELEPDGKTVVICGADLSPTPDGVFWEYTDKYEYTRPVPVDSYHN